MSKVGEYRILPFLESQGVKELEYVFISHGDMDHMSGIEELLQNQMLGVRIREFSPASLVDFTMMHCGNWERQQNRKGRRFYRWRPGRRWHWGN